MKDEKLSMENLTSMEAAPEVVDELASALHDDWRETRRTEDGTYEPRIKTTTDELWIESHGTDQVDIANKAFAGLPDDWRAENAAAAAVVVDYLTQKGLYGERFDPYAGMSRSVDLHERFGLDFSNPAVRLEAGNYIHEAWLDRNDYARGGDLDVKFYSLPKEEQDKDLRQVEIALEQELARRNKAINDRPKDYHAFGEIIVLRKKRR